MATKFTNTQKAYFSPKKLRTKKDAKNIPFNTRLDNWLLKKGLISNRISDSPKKRDMVLSDTQDSKENEKIRKSTKRSSSLSKPREKRKQNVCMNKPKQGILESFIQKSQPDVMKSSSNESCDLPIFKTSKPRGKNNKLYKKYGVLIPTIDEILQEKKELEVYKNQLNSFQCINESCLESLVPSKISEKRFDQCEEILDCKHLSLTQISKVVRKNLKYLQDIMNGRVFNKRHELFYNKNNKPFTLTTKDLTYNTSMVLFTYDQTEYILSELKKYLDPDDKLTQYFFQVLLPELCLKIFIDTHDMSYDNAVAYLDTRPI